MESPRRRGRGFPERIRKVYTAVVTGEGRVLPIVETVGRRVLRDIDPRSAEGRRLLEQGKVDLWSDEGRRSGGQRRPPGSLPLDDRVLTRLSGRHLPDA